MLLGSFLKIMHYPSEFIRGPTFSSESFLTAQLLNSCCSSRLRSSLCVPRALGTRGLSTPECCLPDPARLYISEQRPALSQCRRAKNKASGVRSQELKALFPGKPLLLCLGFFLCAMKAIKTKLTALGIADRMKGNTASGGRLDAVVCSAHSRSQPTAKRSGKRFLVMGCQSRGWKASFQNSKALWIPATGTTVTLESRCCIPVRSAGGEPKGFQVFSPLCLWRPTLRASLAWGAGAGCLGLPFGWATTPFTRPVLPALWASIS